MEAEDGGGLPAAKSKESHNREKERLLNEIDNLKVRFFMSLFAAVENSKIFIVTGGFNIFRNKENM